MKRLRAGLYESTVDGIRVQIEQTQTAYGDSGWIYFLSDGTNEEQSDYPYETKRDAWEQAQAALANGYEWLRRA
jgi:hypothetical protein